jgi:hypothetical protein
VKLQPFTGITESYLLKSIKEKEEGDKKEGAPFDSVIPDRESGSNTMR